MFKNLLLAATLLALSATRVAAQWLEVTSSEIAPYNVPADLIPDHLTGPGVEILDVQFDGAPEAVGYFTGGNNAIGLQRGLVMSTGHVSSAGVGLGAGETGTEFASTNNGITLNDPMLADLTTGPLYDLVRYTITFRASSDSIRFRYVFASEEYPEYACSAFNDVFGFFLEGPGYPSPINIAQVPGGNLPVAINNVHPYNSIYACPGQNEQFYHDNNNAPTQPTYDGYLDIFTAEAAVTPCEVYTITLALADVSDGVFDSAVFLEANSFGGAPDISASFGPGEAILPENAAADTVFLTFNALPTTILPLTVKLGGTAQNGIDYQLLDSVATIVTTDTVLQFLVQPIPDSLNELFETVTFTVRDTGCFFRAFTLYIADPDSAFKPVENLSLSAGTALLTAPAPTALSNLSWSFSNNSPLAIDSINTMIYSDLEVLAGGNGERPIDLATIGSIPLNNLSDINLLESVCVNIQHPWVGDLSLYLFAPNGQYIELSSQNGGNGDNYTNTCFSPLATASITNGMPIAPPSAAPFTGTFQPEGDWKDLLDAPLSGSWRLGMIDRFANLQGQLLNWSLSFSGAQIGNFHYLWSTGDTTKTLLVALPGEYTVTVSNALGAFTKNFIVHEECDVFSQINASICPDGSYNFGGNYLNTAGVYNQTLPNANGCDSLITLTLSVLPSSADSLVVVLAPGETYQFWGQTFSQAGTYQQIFPAANGCDSTFSLILTFSSATAEPGAEATLHLSPNPTAGETQVSWENAQDFTQLRAFDVNGRLVFSQNIAGASRVSIKTTGWSPGWYMLELEGKDGSRARGRLLVKQ